jgi:16S rRNA G966 N2-methylase RsmD
MNKYYNENIQLSKEVINDIEQEIKKKKDCKMLVWGLGYDSDMWWNLTNKNTYFVESKDEYIEMNKSINSNNINKYDYGNINVKISLMIPDKMIEINKIPETIEKLGPFDIILVDGPYGNSLTGKGRLLPIYWSINKLSKSNTLIYIDDVNRDLEDMCVKKYCKQENIVKKYETRKGTIKYLV